MAAENPFLQNYLTDTLVDLGTSLAVAFAVNITAASAAASFSVDTFAAPLVVATSEVAITYSCFTFPWP